MNMVDDDDTRRWFKVVVNVQDINEDGSIKMHPTDHAASTLLQPQIGVGITATDLTDEDGTPAPGISTESGEEATYQWQRSSELDGTWGDISGATGTTYTPQQVIEGDDLGKYLRVVATYTEAGEGGLGGRTAIATSMYPTIPTIGDNNAPSFTEGEATTRPVRENERNTIIGARVAATNPESGAPHNEKLTYWLSEAEGSDVTDALGDITETLTPEPVPANTATSDTAGDANYVHALFSIDPDTGQLKTKGPLDYEVNPYYAVTVNVADSSDNTPTNTAEITVIIRVLQTNDEPEIAGASTIEHVEGGTALDTDLSNGDSPPTADVARYDATDEDPTDTTLEFSLEGADKDLLRLRNTTDAEEAGANATPADVTRQVLEFKEKPDYEKPMDANKDNVYEVTVKVFDGEETTTKDVTVKVTNKQEDGKVEVTPVQARIGVPMRAKLTDSDIVAYGPRWQWQRRMVTTACDLADDPNEEADNWMSIPGADSEDFTPREIDYGYCLNAVATYNDGYHEYDTVPAPVSMPSASGLYTDEDTRFDKRANKALSSVQYPSDPNITPVFSSAMTKRFVLENGAVNNPVGRPVTARDGNGPDDALTYTLSGGATDAFSIRPQTGQLMTKMEFDHEIEDMYTVMVTATDTLAASDTIEVEIYVVDVDEKSRTAAVGALGITGPSTVNYAEGGTGDVGNYSVSGAGDRTVSLRLTGRDRQDFRINNGVVTFASTTDYEKKSSYAFTVTATVGTGQAAEDLTHGVTVNVTNVREDGSVSLSTDTPRAGAEIMAMVEDEDIVDDATVRWQWESSVDGSTQWAPIEGARDATYMVAETDSGDYLRARASYTDGYGSDRATSEATENAVTGNTAPEFALSADDRSVAENTAAGENIGAAVAATDVDTGDSLTYTLGGTDAASFTIEASTGQLQVKDALDFETKTTYEVEVTATDEADASAMIPVTITVEDVSLGTLGDTYDSNNDELIDRDDLVDGVRAFQDQTIDRDGLVALVRLYQAYLATMGN